jgi:hypothetical protein
MMKEHVNQKLLANALVIQPILDMSADGVANLKK